MNKLLFAVLCYGIISSVSAQNTENGHEYVDLGLSVKWATCNVDANKPEDTGGYYSWGETNVKNEYLWSNYKYSNGSNRSTTKYCVDSEYGNEGFIDNKTTLELADDVAHQKWGGHWRMPTNEDFMELLNKVNCKWEWTSYNGVDGYKVTSIKPGFEDNYIFLPAVGLYTEKGFLPYTNGYYLWTSSLGKFPSAGGVVLLTPISHELYIGLTRFSGLPVRPVYSPNITEEINLDVSENTDNTNGGFRIGSLCVLIAIGVLVYFVYRRRKKSE